MYIHIKNYTYIYILSAVRSMQYNCGIQLCTYLVAGRCMNYILQLRHVTRVRCATTP